MTNAMLLAMLRRRLRDVDPLAPLYDADVLWGYVGDQLTMFQVRKVQGMGVISAPDALAGFVVAVPDDVGAMLIVGAAAMLLKDLYNEKVASGEFGVSWRSGLESESSVDAMKAYGNAVHGLDSELDALTLIRASTTSGTRVQ